MSDTSHIDISVEVQDEQFDMRVPREVTFGRLGTLIVQSLREEGVVVPSPWELKIKQKDFSLESSDWGSDFAVPDGDMFVVEPNMQERKQ